MAGYADCLAVFLQTLRTERANLVGSLGSAEAQQRLSRSLEISELPPDEFAAATVPSMFSPSVDHELVHGFVDSVRGFRPRGFQAMARAAFEDQSHVLPEVDVPMLLLSVLHGPGHVSSVEAADDVSLELRRFLRALGS